MSYQDYAYFLWALQTVVGGFLLLIGLANGVARHFPAFFCYIGYCLVGNVSAIVVVWAVEYNSRLHGIFFEVCGILALGFLMFACAEAYRIVRIRSSAWIWAAMIATGLFLGTGVAPSSVFQWSRLAQAAILHVALYFVLAILIQAWLNRGLRLGRNLSGILWSMAIIVSSQYLLFASMSVEPALYSVARWFIQPGFVLGIAVPLFYVRGLDLPLVQPRRSPAVEGS